MSATRTQRNSKNHVDNETIESCTESSSYGLEVGDDGVNNSRRVSSDDTTRSNDSLWRRSRLSPEFDSKAMSSLRLNPKQNENVLKLSINKLRFESVGFYGREKETAALRECLDRLTAPGSKDKEIVMIKGYSGVGKSSLAAVLEKPVQKTKGIFATGKFDLHHRDEPYSAISDAYGQICQQITTVNGEKEENLMKKINKTILSELETEVKLLQTLIPDLAEITGDHHVEESNPTADDWSLEAMQERLKYAFRLLTRILSSNFSPLVIFLDDLQWADVSSLEVIDMLMSDRQNPNPLMIVGCYRSNEVDVDHILSKTMCRLEEKKERTGIGITEINVENFKVSEVNHVIMALLSIDDEARTHGLAEICYKRTHGNPFFLLEFVKMLEEESLIDFNLGLFQWVWSESDIEQKTSSTANVVNLLQTKMRKFPQEVQQLLMHAACLGSTFSVTTMSLIWANYATNHSPNHAPCESTLIELLSNVEEDQLIETCGMSEYRWVHDKVQEAALSLIPEEEGASFQYSIGMTLYRGLGEKELDSVLFDVVNLINSGSAKGSEFAHLNLRAAEKAKDIAAFDSAAKYASIGISLLPNEKWRNVFALTLDLYSTGAEVEESLGRIDAMEDYCQEVIAQKKCSTMEKLRAYKARINGLLNAERKYHEAIELCVSVLEGLGCYFPRNHAIRAVRAIVALLHTVNATRRTPREVYENLPMMTDPKSLAIVKLLDRLGQCCYFAKESHLLLLSTLRLVQITLSSGVNDFSGVAFAAMGMLTTGFLNDFSTGSKFAEHALLMQGRLKTKSTEARVLLICNYGVFPWTKLLQNCISPLLEGYESGMRAGDTESALYALGFGRILIPLILGRSLRTVEADCRALLAQSEEFKVEELAFFLRIIWQTILNLTAKSNNTVSLVGEAMDEYEASRATVMSTATVKLYESYLCAFFAEHELGAALALERGDEFFKVSPGSCNIMHDALSRGISLYAMARKTKKKTLKKEANRIRKMIKSWFKKGNPNVGVYLHLLNAEQAALSGKNVLAEREYRESVVLATRGGYLQYAGLANERYSEFLLNEVGDEEEARYHVEEAIRFYDEWGASRKVELLRKKFQVTSE